MIKINQKQKVILAIGGGFIATLWLLSFIVKSTTWLDRPAIICNTFPTKSKAFPAKEIKICLTEIVAPFNSLAEDADYQISFYNQIINRRIDLTMRVSIPSKFRQLTILWRVQHVQLYNPNGIMVKNSSDRYTSNHSIYLPIDVITPLWFWLVADISQTYIEPHLDIESQIDGTVEKFSRIAATVTATGLTAWRFLQAASQ
ncbi:hypothetical protein KBY79_12215 [Synechococcus lacustris C3-12m-Tous]|uniref:hypothetical protein n=1 Tax=Synechococcus lacustris TaxID=2116544 RepID=UPI0020CF1D8F|nr:hypothetical protein [Synechococcus lacustris]MCP9925972.1 hypothetical protein [Synechococcus lacustris C3-12m-Tous]